ncbi:hypothetical protein ACXWP2_09400, partial [Streptococcus pyogenes]
RLNAWSEITAMITPILAFSALSLWTDVAFPNTLFIIVAITIACTLLVTWLTPPTDRGHLETFYRTTRVGGVLWKPVSKNLPDV